MYQYPIFPVEAFMYNAFQTRKQVYTIWGSYPEYGTRAVNPLENVEYITDVKTPIILKGTVDEEWVTSVEKVCQTYDYIDQDGNELPLRGNHFPLDGCYIPLRSKPDATNVYAMFVPVDEIYTLQTTWGQTLTINNPMVEHGEGDYVIAAMNSYDGRMKTDDMWVVNGLVFPNTYIM